MAFDCHHHGSRFRNSRRGDDECSNARPSLRKSSEPCGLRGRKGELFTLGLFSRLDTLFSRPLSELIAHIDLAEDIRSTLLETVTTPHTISRLWALVLAYEIGDWDHAFELMPQVNLEPAILTNAYSNALAWAESVCKRQSL